MKNIKAVLNVLFLGVLLFTFNSCTEDNPVIERTWEEGAKENGSLLVFVHINASSTYLGGDNWENHLHHCLSA